MIYFISDSHIGHRGSLYFRPEFKTIKEIEDLIIFNWNSIITDDDEVYILGDFAYKCSKRYAEEIFWQLNGHKHLISGNHDYKIANNFIKCWESISDIKQVDFVNDKGCVQEIILCHYPMLSWRHKQQGSWHLHGHTHGSIQDLNKGTKRYDVSVEVNKYTPISLEQLKKILC